MGKVSPKSVSRLAFAALLVASLANCRSEDQGSSSSQVQTLDNAAAAPGTALVENQCGTTLTDLTALPTKVNGLNSSEYLQAPDDALRLAALSALNAAPATLLRILFNGLHAQVIVTPEATSLCQATPFTDEEREIVGNATVVPSCWLAPTATQPLRLVVLNDPTLIRFTMLRLLAFSYTEYLVTKLADPAAPAPLNTAAWQEALAGFNASNQTLARLFLGEVPDASSRAKLQAAESSNPTSFGFMVYANAIDSYYCSPASKTAFTADFPQTYKAFTNLGNPHSPLAQLGQ